MGQALRHSLMSNGCVWVGGELESVNHAITNGVMVNITNCGNFPEPYLITDYLRLERDCREIRAVDKVDYSREGSIVANGKVVDKPYTDFKYSRNGQRKLRSLELPMLMRYRWIVLIGGSPGDGFRDYINLVNNRKIMVIDPRSVEFPCYHKRMYVTEDNIVETIDEWTSVPKKDIAVHIDIRRERCGLCDSEWED